MTILYAWSRANKTPAAVKRDPIRRAKRAQGILWTAVTAVLTLLLICVLGSLLYQISGDPMRLREWLDRRGVQSRALFLGVQVLQGFIAIIPPELLAIARGYAFGPVEGALLCLIGSAVSTVLVFYTTKIAGLRLVEYFIPRERIFNLKYLKEGRRRNLLLFLTFLLPGMPKHLATYAAGLTTIRCSRFLALTTAARLPFTVLLSFGGNALNEQNTKSAAILFIIVGAVGFLGVLLYKWIQHIRKNTK
jgi:uncharacterized membrane protein YdjX (TVP38/TMEM64 family)